MTLLPGWNELVDAARTERAPDTTIVGMRLDLTRATAAVRHVADADAADLLLAELRSTPVAAIALTFYDAFPFAPFELRSGAVWQDSRARKPVCVGLAAWLHGASPDEPDGVLLASLDVRDAGVVEALGELLRIRTPFVFHDAKPALFSCWALGLDPDFFQLYDTHLAAACLQLGADHKRGQLRRGTSVGEHIEAERELRRASDYRLSLAGQCAQFGVAHPGAQREPKFHEALDAGFLDHLAAIAGSVLHLYVAQQPALVRHGLASHLHQVEFPFAVANARIESRGVHVDPQLRGALRDACQRAAEHYATCLRTHGIERPSSIDEFVRQMGRLGLRHHLVRGGEVRTDDNVLREVESLHPAIKAFRLRRLYAGLAAGEWLNGRLDGADGRVHPIHRQLGTATGRLSCSTPNFAGLSRILRPVVTAPPGRALMELDFSQIEIGVAAAEHRDPALLAAFNSGDVYSAMALEFYAEQLPAEDKVQPLAFKQRRPDLRDRMKQLVLSVLYNIQAPSIALRFGISVAQAEHERTRFIDSYPALKRHFGESAVFGRSCGYASMVSGLRRRVPGNTGDAQWIENLLRNTPIQGSAAVVFKHALIDLDAHFRGTDTWLILPVHDAVVIECAAAEVDSVAERAQRIMESALRAYYPTLVPRVEVNKSHPHCWNKDGHADSLLGFFEDPEFQLRRAARSVDVEVAAPLGTAHDAHATTTPGLGTTAAADIELLRARVEWARICQHGVLDQAPTSWTADLREAFEERAAIIEYDGGLSRAEAELWAELAVRERCAEVGHA